MDIILDLFKNFLWHYSDSLYGLCDMAFARAEERTEGNKEEARGR